ncbi:MAG: ATP-binding protein [Chitinivibrionales bacterium]|nr:ATP-binding protein [Chitinivibrionales bacterium]
MERDLLTYLKSWKHDPIRKPLIIRGARQVGKTWLVNNFGETAFNHYFSINFELSPEYKSCFDTLDPKEILTRIELTANISLSGDDTLLFLDEIQECPSALKSLRYFYEKHPSLYVIATGSLLEFIESSDDISIPVGRVMNYYLSPLSFGEFLSACEEFRLREYLRSLSITTKIPHSIEEKCIVFLRKYLYTGGMPAAVADWITRKDFSSTDILHRSLLQNYRHDFGKYGRKINHELLEKAFMKIPGLVGTAVTYTAIDEHSPTREIKRAVELLEKARIHTRVRSTSATGLPFYTYVNDRRFKTLFLDVGLLQNAMGIGGETYLAKDLLAVYRGAVTEQYVGQQLLALKKPYEEPDLFYWHRNAPGSEAEVDFLFQKGETIIPIEVKSGKSGSLKSLQLFLKENNTPFGVRFSMLPLSLHEKILSIPLYAVEALPALIEQASLVFPR